MENMTGRNSDSDERGLRTRLSVRIDSYTYPDGTNALSAWPLI